MQKANDVLATKVAERDKLQVEQNALLSTNADLQEDKRRFMLVNALHDVLYRALDEESCRAVVRYAVALWRVLSNMSLHECFRNPHSNKNKESMGVLLAAYTAVRSCNVPKDLWLTAQEVVLEHAPYGRNPPAWLNAHVKTFSSSYNIMEREAKRDGCDLEMCGTGPVKEIAPGVRVRQVNQAKFEDVRSMVHSLCPELKARKVWSEEDEEECTSEEEDAAAEGETPSWVASQVESRKKSEPKVHYRPTSFVNQHIQVAMHEAVGVLPYSHFTPPHFSGLSIHECSHMTHPDWTKPNCGVETLNPAYISLLSSSGNLGELIAAYWGCSVHCDIEAGGPAVDTRMRSLQRAPDTFALLLSPRAYTHEPHSVNLVEVMGADMQDKIRERFVRHTAKYHDVPEHKGPILQQRDGMAHISFPERIEGAWLGVPAEERHLEVGRGAQPQEIPDFQLVGMLKKKCRPQPRLSDLLKLKIDAGTMPAHEELISTEEILVLADTVDQATARECAMTAAQAVIAIRGVIRRGKLKKNADLSCSLGKIATSLVEKYKALGGRPLGLRTVAMALIKKGEEKQWLNALHYLFPPGIPGMTASLDEQRALKFDRVLEKAAVQREEAKETRLQIAELDRETWALQRELRNLTLLSTQSVEENEIKLSTEQYAYLSSVVKESHGAKMNSHKMLTVIRAVACVQDILQKGRVDVFGGLLDHKIEHYLRDLTELNMPCTLWKAVLGKIVEDDCAVPRPLAKRLKTFEEALTYKNEWNSKKALSEWAKRMNGEANGAVVDDASEAASDEVPCPSPSTAEWWHGFTGAGEEPMDPFMVLRSDHGGEMALTSEKAKQVSDAIPAKQIAKFNFSIARWMDKGFGPRVTEVKDAWKEVHNVATVMRKYYLRHLWRRAYVAIRPSVFYVQRMWRGYRVRKAAGRTPTPAHSSTDTVHMLVNMAAGCVMDLFKPVSENGQTDARFCIRSMPPHEHLIRDGFAEEELAQPMWFVASSENATAFSMHDWDAWSEKPPNEIDVGINDDDDTFTDGVLFYRNVNNMRREEAFLSNVFEGMSTATRVNLLTIMAASPFCCNELYHIATHTMRYLDAVDNLTKIVKMLLEPVTEGNEDIATLLTTIETEAEYHGLFTWASSKPKRPKVKGPKPPPKAVAAPAPKMSKAEGKRVASQAQRVVEQELERVRAEQAPAVEAAAAAKRLAEEERVAKAHAAFVEKKAAEDAQKAAKAKAAQDAEKEAQEAKKQRIAARRAEASAKAAAKKVERKAGPKKTAFQLQEEYERQLADAKAEEEAKAAEMAAAKEKKDAEDRARARAEQDARNAAAEAKKQREREAKEARRAEEQREREERAAAEKVAEEAEKREEEEAAVRAIQRERLDAATAAAAAAAAAAPAATGRGGRGGRGRGRGRESETTAWGPPPTTEDDLCIVCFADKKTHACYPCGHMCLCVGCVGNYNPLEKGCPTCRAPVQGIMKVYT